MRRFIIAALAVLFLIPAKGALAAQSTTTFTVTATVTATCSISATNLAFGSINVLSGSNIDASSTITATCTNGTAYNIGLDAGQGSGATVSSRKMTSGSDTLSYGLFTNSSRTTNWDDIGGSNVASGTGNGVAQNVTVYGRIPTGQGGAAIGSYIDTINVTIDFN